MCLNDNQNLFINIIVKFYLIIIVYLQVQHPFPIQYYRSHQMLHIF